MTLLCVDDDPDDVDVFCDAVKEVDMTVRCVAACCGQQALEILQSGLLPDYIFLDINMPKMNGMETLKRIKKDDRLRNVPVVMYSTTMNPREITAYKREGADYFLIKHHLFHDLCDALAALIQTGVLADHAKRNG